MKSIDQPRPFASGVDVTPFRTPTGEDSTASRRENRLDLLIFSGRVAGASGGVTRCSNFRRYRLTSDRQIISRNRVNQPRDSCWCAGCAPEYVAGFETRVASNLSRPVEIFPFWKDIDITAKRSGESGCAPIPLC